jgi:hypothetical protein
MAHFYAEIQGNRGKVSRTGTKSSGMWAHVRGWDTGVEVRLSVSKEDGSDMIEVWLTGGSNKSATRHLLYANHAEVW